MLPYLFGSILTVTWNDVRVIIVLGVLIVTTLVFAGRALFAIVLDEESARVAGLPVDTLNTLLAALTAVTIVAAMRVVGVLLVAALMVIPVATSRLLARSFACDHRRRLRRRSRVGDPRARGGPRVGARAGRRDRAHRRRVLRPDEHRHRRRPPGRTPPG